MFPLILSLLYIVDFGVLTPIYSNVCSDILYLDSYLPFILELVMEILRLVIWCYIFSVSLFAICQNISEIKKAVFISTPIIAFLRYIIPLIINAVLYNIPLNGEDMSYAFLNFVFDMIQITLIWIFATALNNRKKQTGIRKSIKISACFGAALISLVRIIIRITFDVSYGAPESAAEIGLMALYYLSDIFYGLMLYFLTVIAVGLLSKKSTK